MAPELADSLRVGVDIVADRVADTAVCWYPQGVSAIVSYPELPAFPSAYCSVDVPAVKT